MFIFLAKFEKNKNKRLDMIDKIIYVIIIQAITHISR